MHPFRRPAFLYIVALVLLPPGGEARADGLAERLSALRLLQLQSNLWRPIEKCGLTLNGSVESRYTTNAALAQGGTSDWYLAPSASAIWSQDEGGGWRGAAGCDVGGYRYLRQTDLGTSYLDAWGSAVRDFQLGRAKGEFYVTCNQQWTQLKNYTKSGSSTEAIAGLNCDWEIRPGHGLSFNPVASTTPYSSPWDSGFHSYGATITYNWALNSSLDVSVYYNGYLTCYFSGQSDYTQYLGAKIAWSPSKNFSLSVSVTQTWNSSTNPGSEYSAFDAGGMVGIQWRL
ncbi:MAG: hypothetical protein WCO94_14780 [Verrucomicrobiota bacterium]